MVSVSDHITFYDLNFILKQHKSKQEQQHFNSNKITALQKLQLNQK